MEKGTVEAAMVATMTVAMETTRQREICFSAK